MSLSERRRAAVLVLAGLLFVVAGFLGVALGMSLAVNQNTKNMDELLAYRSAIPSKVLDINGELITEFFSDEKREIVSITSLPENLIYAVLTREDAPFFEHTGFSLFGFFRAVTQTARYFITGKGSLQGGSTITMQLAGVRHADRTNDLSLKRKLKELWWTFQLERRFTKQEILEQYLNSVYFGHNTYGVEAASQFFFGHSAVDNSPSESVMLVIQLAGSALYSPLIKPDVARDRQREILNQMVLAGYVSATEADESFQNYWENFDWSRSSTDSPYFDRLAGDKAPFFSEYIRTEIEQYLFGRQDIYRDGYVIHTTLDLEMQTAAEKAVDEGLLRWNQVYRNDRDAKTRYATAELEEIIDLLSFSFDIPEIYTIDTREKRQAIEYFENDLMPFLDIMSMSFGVSELKSLSGVAYGRAKIYSQMNNVETALITLDNQNGYIKAMIGGSEFSRNNQFNRAMHAKVMPGSAFKPLYFSAAISSGDYTAASMIYDGPEQFISPDGTSYTPGNYTGLWNGYILLRDALARSLNVPAIKVLETIGFASAINRSARLLGINDPQKIGETFERVYPLGLGTLSVTPVSLSQAYATMANRGNAVEPIAIRYIEDRDGNIIVNPEQDLREEQERQNMQIMSAQAAYVMTSLLQSTVDYGTLSYARRSVGGFDGMPMAGKTGTTQNWTDAWTVGYSPYYTSSLWIGFDRRGNSLGQGQTGASATGPVWAKYMKAIHENLPRMDFPRPENGIVMTQIDRRTGMLPDLDTPENFLRTEVFIAGTEPQTQGNLAAIEAQYDEAHTIKVAVDSSNFNIDDESASNMSMRDLLSELGLEPHYLDAKKYGKKASPSHQSSASSIMD